MHPKARQAWSNLKDHAQILSKKHLRELFASDQQRADNFSLSVGSIFLDYSKNLISSETLDLLTKLAQDSELSTKINAMFSGAKINNTENRAVLHTALRAQTKTPLWLDGVEVTNEVRQQLDKMSEFSQLLRNKKILGATGKVIKEIVNIGIGGSDLGPNLVCDALQAYQHPELKVHFWSNVDSEQFYQIANIINPETTLFIITSKSFSTAETITNAQCAKRWLKKNGINDINKHFVAISSNVTAAESFGVRQVFTMWDWVGGRFSLWSTVGLSIMIAIGVDNYYQLLQGAYEMDVHFKQAEYPQNMPIILALLSVWYQSFLHAGSRAVLPYDENLRLLPSYLQQLEMESNGKSVDIDGNPIEHPTAGIIWGSLGIKGQHAFYQLLHQGKIMVPAEFIITINDNNHLDHHHDMLMANYIAQTEALMQGRNSAETIATIQNSQQNSADTVNYQHMVFSGNNPSSSIMLDQLTPKSLGSLLAMYEHKVFVEGVIWHINSFDQWGVELGKKLASVVLSEITSKNTVNSHDGSTNNLINRYLELKK